MKPPIFAALLAFCVSSLAAESPRVLPPGELPKDARLGPLKELDGYFPFTPPESREAWTQRAEQVRMQLRVALGLFPEPTRTPLKAVVHGRLERDDHTVEKVFFESMPGFFVTGSLFRPKTPGPHPGALVAHGHWKDARFIVRDDAAMKKELESGGEVLPESGRSIFQSIGVQLARMGIVALVYDMLGDSDAQQISYEVAHKFAKQRPEMNTRENWGLYSPQAEAHAQNIMGLQTWNSIRALDFLTSLPDVDPQRLGCTGASGGGTQTLMLAALDPRLAVSIPCVMTSTAMQGGCTCENATLARVGTGNVEIAALFAPKPQAMTTAKDWTIEMPEKGFPDLQKLYALLGAKENVALWHMPHFPHNYNSATRHEIYRWFNTHFRLGRPAGRLTERDYPLLTKEQLTVWDTAHPAPAGGDDFERKLLKWWHDDAQKTLAASDFSRVAPAWKSLLGIDGLSAAAVETSREVKVDGGGKTFDAGLAILRAKDGTFALPMIAMMPPAPRGQVLWLDERGKAGLFTDTGSLRPEVVRLLDAGMAVVGADLLGQGELQPADQSKVHQRRTKNPRQAAAYTFGYNRSAFAERVRDVCALLSLAPAGAAPLPRSVIALDSTGPIAAVALAVLGKKIDAAAIRAGDFRFGAVLDLHSPEFLPAAAKYGDLPTALDLARRNATRLQPSAENASPADAVSWLLGGQ